MKLELAESAACNGPAIQQAITKNIPAIRRMFIKSGFQRKVRIGNGRHASRAGRKWTAHFTRTAFFSLIFIFRRRRTITKGGRDAKKPEAGKQRATQNPAAFGQPQCPIDIKANRH
ncbi:hypothetical protein NP603_11270 [Methylomonas sp. SURF-1]|uniref:Uncharacterized protein n=1 Tax=Methylomonas aurea TaxID=2952224 RepID=A0ABT1UHM0_9GAMM|nr:hypothetical protein [Methylomonas sp. SURF-1]MCQ8181690.1 hypothetical protein [Methylomonas sp. SURF-1]